MPENTDDPPIKAVRTALQIAEHIKRERGARIKDISNEFGMPHSTVHDHVKTLEALRFIKKGANQTYFVGMRFLEIGGCARWTKAIYRVGKHEVRRFSDRIEEHVNLWTHEHGVAYLLEKASPSNNVSLQTHDGMEVPMHTIASGKVMMAFMPDEEIQEIIARHGLNQPTPYTITDVDELFEELAAIKENGYAVDREERMLGVNSIAAPVMGGSDIIGAIDIIGPKNRLGPHRLAELSDGLLQTANTIEVNFLYSLGLGEEKAHWRTLQE